MIRLVAPNRSLGMGFHHLRLGLHATSPWGLHVSCIELRAGWELLQVATAIEPSAGTSWVAFPFCYIYHTAVRPPSRTGCPVRWFLCCAVPHLPPVAGNRRRQAPAAGSCWARATPRVKRPSGNSKRRKGWCSRPTRAAVGLVLLGCGEALARALRRLPLPRGNTSHAVLLHPPIEGRWRLALPPVFDARMCSPS